MSRAENRSQMMDKLGAVQLNTVWSWCAVNESEKKVYFSAWVDCKLKIDGKLHYLIQEPNWGLEESSGTFSPARNDQDVKLRLVFEEAYESYLYFIEAEDPMVHPRSIKAIRTSFVFKADIKRLDSGNVVALPIQRIELD